MKKKTILSELKKAPNLITLTRYVLLPFLYYFAYTKQIVIFVILFIISGLSDYIDGYIARKLNQCSTFGANMDRIADELTQFSALAFLFFIAKETLLDYAVPISVAVILAIINKAINIFFFKNKNSFHTISAKASGYLFYISFSISFLFNIRQAILPYIFIISIDQFEEILIIIKYKTINENIRSIFTAKQDLKKHE
ncbi:MAG: CDP-alcohol phosphatidyltransferase family protein [archaeon]